MSGFSHVQDTPESFAAGRDGVLRRIIHALQSDSRVVAAWLAGSLGRGEGDEWADLDLHVVIEDDSMDSFLSGRTTLYESIGKASLIQDEIPGQGYVGNQFHLVIFEGGIEVDWSFLRASEALKPTGHRLLFERNVLRTAAPERLDTMARRALAQRWLTFFWAMAPIAIRLCARGDTRRAASQTDLLTRALICLWRLTESDANDPWQPDENRPLEDDIDRRLPKLGQELTPEVVLRQVERLIEASREIQPSLEVLGAKVNPAIVADTERLIALARRAISKGSFRPLKYR